MEDISFVQDLAFILLTAGATAWIFRSLGLSAVVGCILAGVLIGPYTPLFPTVSDVARVEALAQIGLVFLMFWIGLGFSLQKLRRLGFHTLLANVIGAVILFHVFRLIGTFMGWSPVASVFLAAMTMISSSSIIMKTLAEVGINHEKPSQRALTIAIGEDAVVILLLTLLSSYVQVGEKSAMNLPLTLGVLALFISLFLVSGLILVPRVLAWLRKSADSETITVLVTGLIFMFALISVRAGYSLALGAFLLGAITADTVAKNQIERLLSGVYFLLSAVFFTAIGMLIEPSVLKKIWPQVLLLSFLIMLFRIIAYSTGLLIIGNRLREALKTGLYLTPIGEFSFIIASLGVTTGVLGKDTYALAVGICFVTALISPLLARNSDLIADRGEKLVPSFLKTWLELYQKALQWLEERQKGNLLWRLSRPRLWQMVRELAMVTALLIFSPPLYHFLAETEQLKLFPEQALFWTFASLVALAVSLPLLALWRNLFAMSLLFSEGLTHGLPNRKRLSSSLNMSFRLAGLIILSAWILFLLPWSRAAAVGVIFWILLLLGFIIVFHRRLILWHSRFEVMLDESVSPSSHGHASWSQLRHPVEELNLELVEVEVPDETPHAGRSIAQLNMRKSLGATIAGIERQGCLISAPGPDQQVYPNDRVLLLGSAAAIKSARSFLQNKSAQSLHVSDFNEIGLEQLLLSAESPLLNRTLLELNLSRDYSLTIVGIRRNKEIRLNLKAGDYLLAGDELLVLASPGNFNKLRHYASHKTASRPEDEVNGTQHA